MKILLVNKFHWNKGGSEKYYFELGELLKSHGHEIAYFSMEDDRNINTGDLEYFVPKFDLNHSSKLRAIDVIYNKNNKKIMEKALDEFQPDIVHLNNFQRQLSASIIDSCKKRHIPVVYTAHDAQAICPAITMMDLEGNVCELCTGGKYFNCIKKSCNKGSKMKSILGAIEGYYYRNHKIYSKKINKIITPSNFLKKKFINDGYLDDQIVVLPNYVDVSDYSNDIKDGGYAFYFGRLSDEKGVVNLVKAFSKCQRGLLYIAGEGEKKDEIYTFIKKYNLEKKVKLLGFLGREKIISYLSSCRFVIVPSICSENCPYSIIEALAAGKPVIATNNGGIPELVINNENGFIYEYDDIEELSKKMDILFDDDQLVKRFSKKAKACSKLYDKEKYYQNIIKLYQELIKGEK